MRLITLLIKLALVWGEICSTLKKDPFSIDSLHEQFNSNQLSTETLVGCLEEEISNQITLKDKLKLEFDPKLVISLDQTKEAFGALSLRLQSIPIIVDKDTLRHKLYDFDGTTLKDYLNKVGAVVMEVDNQTKNLQPVLYAMDKKVATLGMVTFEKLSQECRGAFCLKLTRDMGYVQKLSDPDKFVGLISRNLNDIDQMISILNSTAHNQTPQRKKQHKMRFDKLQTNKVGIILKGADHVYDPAFEVIYNALYDEGNSLIQLKLKSHYLKDNKFHLDSALDYMTTKTLYRGSHTERPSRPNPRPNFGHGILDRRSWDFHRQFNATAIVEDIFNSQQLDFVVLHNDEHEWIRLATIAGLPSLTLPSHESSLTSITILARHNYESLLVHLVKWVISKPTYHNPSFIFKPGHAQDLGVAYE